MENLDVICPRGTFMEINTKEAKPKIGLISNQIDNPKYCMEEAIWKDNDKDVNEQCTKYMDTNYVLKQLNDCRNKFKKLSHD